MKALIGKKIGMTQIYKEDGTAVAVTVLDVADNVVSRYIKDGENVTHVEIGRGKEKKSNKADTGNYKALQFVPKVKQVFKTNSDELGEVGKQLNATLFEEGEKVTVIGTTKGKGFQGVMKRWNFKGGKRTHGQSDRDRAPGSIGSGTTPGRVLKGKKMAGRMGREKETRKNIAVVAIMPEDNVIAVKGSLPGFNGSYVVIKS